MVWSTGAPFRRMIQIGRKFQNKDGDCAGFGGTAWAFTVALMAECAGIGLYALSGETHNHGDKNRPVAVNPSEEEGWDKERSSAARVDGTEPEESIVTRWWSGLVCALRQPVRFRLQGASSPPQTPVPDHHIGENVALLSGTNSSMPRPV